MNVKIVASWKNNKKGEMLLIIWKIIKLILEARKSSEKKSSKKNMAKKKRKKKKQAEKANSSLNQKARVKRIQGSEH